MRILSSDKTRFIIKVVLICMALAMICTLATYAWFAYSTQVEEDGLGMQAKVTPNLLIAKTENDLRALTVTSASPFSVTEDSAVCCFIPATHWNRYGTETTENCALYYLKNSYAVDPSTGLAADSENPLELGNIGGISDEKKGYFYKDYDVYIGSATSDMNKTTIKATLEMISKGTNDENSYNALSIDFYVNSVSDDNYRGTLNLAGYDAEINDHSTPCTAVVILDNGTVYCNTDTSNDHDPIHVVMRCYFDGALLKDDTTAFINTEKVSADGVSVTVNFTATQTAP